MPTKAEVQAARMAPVTVQYLRVVKYPSRLRGAPPMLREIERCDAARLARQHKVIILEEEV